MQMILNKEQTHNEGVRKNKKKERYFLLKLNSFNVKEKRKP